MTNKVESKTHWKKFFNYDYLGSYSLPEGNDIIVTIKELKKQMVTGQAGQKQECTVMYFVEGCKPMILNRTNSKTIQRLYNTPYVEEWAGKKIQLYVKENISAFGQITDGLRIRDFVPENLTNDQQKIKDISAKIRQALKNYKGSDREELRSKATENKNNLTGLSEVLNALTK